MALNPTQQDVDQQIDITLDKSVDATRRILQTAQQTETVGVETSTKLVEQGEKLDKIEGQQTKIDKSVARNKSQLSALERCCGVFIFKRKLNQMSEEAYQKSSDSPLEPKSGENQKNISNSSKPNEGQKSGTRVEANTGVKTGTVKITDDAREDEIEDNLGAVNDIVGNLKSLALGMGNELDKQNEQLDRINKQTEKNDSNIHDLDHRTRKLLGQQVSVEKPSTSIGAKTVAKALL